MVAFETKTKKEKVFGGVTLEDWIQKASSEILQGKIGVFVPVVTILNGKGENYSIIYTLFFFSIPGLVEGYKLGDYCSTPADPMSLDSCKSAIDQILGRVFYLTLKRGGKVTYFVYAPDFIFGFEKVSDPKQVIVRQVKSIAHSYLTLAKLIAFYGETIPSCSMQPVGTAPDPDSVAIRATCAGGIQLLLQKRGVMDWEVAIERFPFKEEIGRQLFVHSWDYKTSSLLKGEEKKKFLERSLRIHLRFANLELQKSLNTAARLFLRLDFGSDMFSRIQEEKFKLLRCVTYLSYAIYEAGSHRDFQLIYDFIESWETLKNTFIEGYDDGIRGEVNPDILNYLRSIGALY